MRRRSCCGNRCGDAATPLFFLTLWMAACSLALRAADAPTLVTRAGGNGERFGIGLAVAPGRWFSVPATPPRGRLLANAAADTPVCGAIGDSAVIDMLGFGAQRFARAPEPLGVLHDFLPEGMRVCRSACWRHCTRPFQRSGSGSRRGRSSRKMQRRWSRWR